MKKVRSALSLTQRVLSGRKFCSCCQTFSCKVKHVLFQSKYDEKPELGDLIEIFRGTYQHWAVYVGEGFVVHLSPPCESHTDTLQLQTNILLRYLVHNA